MAGLTSKLLGGQKRKLIALVAVVAAIGVITGTGAFTTVSADRTATVNVAGDESALLQLAPTNGPNGDGAYAEINDDDVLEINLDGPDGTGVNLDALTTVDNVFNITNQGTQPVEVYINTTGANDETVTFYAGTVASGTPLAVDSPTTLAVGETVTVSMRIDTRGESLSDGEELINEITIYANAS